MDDLILRGGIIAGTQQDMAIQHGRIRQIAPQIFTPAQTTLDIVAKLVLPGFIESHIHPDKAFIADRTGRAEDFFLPGLLLNAAYAAAYLVSIAIRWPLLGVILGPITGEGMSWRSDPERVRLYSRASWIWVGVFALRLAVQLPLYLAGAVLALGIAKTAMGLPIFLVAIWLSYLVLRGEGEPQGEGSGARMLN